MRLITYRALSAMAERESGKDQRDGIADKSLLD